MKRKRMQTKRQAHGDATAARDLARDVAALPPISKGRDIRIVESSRHGKNVAGAKVTSTFQVRDYSELADGYMLKGQFRFRVGNEQSRLDAWDRARARATALGAAFVPAVLPKKSVDIPPGAVLSSAHG